MTENVWIWFCFAAAVACPFATKAAESRAAASLKVAAVQMRSSRNLDDNVSRITNSNHACARNGARVVVFPECALSSYDAEVVTRLTDVQITAAAQPGGRGVPRGRGLHRRRHRLARRARNDSTRC